MPRQGLRQRRKPSYKALQAQTQVDWEALRWRQVDWELIPPDMRDRVVTFLDVPDNIHLNNALTSHKVMSSNEDESEKVELRDQLIKSYRGALIPAFDTYRFTEKNDFEGLRWVEEMGIELQGLELVLVEQEGGVVKKAEKVLRWLVDGEREELATLHATKSRAKDMVNFDGFRVANISTLWKAAEMGYVPVVRALVTKGADMNKVMRNGATPLYIASQNGHVEVVSILAERGADINKANNNGTTPLWIASGKGHVEVVRVLAERGADMNKANNDEATPLTIAKRFNHTEIIRLLERAQAIQSSGKKSSKNKK